jgi:site-specific DNA recombinase
MKIADLYVRVSTDEQADKGYSQRNQEEVLRKYCEINSIQVRKVMFEDYSAKTFNRPEWTKLLIDLKKYKGKSDLILFTKWDRFSRNAGDAYQMISTLRRLGTEPQAVEQPLDLSIPENKMMLAFYLAAPEVENDRRALNVIYGMRRAKKEGRWMATAPVGYVNKTDENGRKNISPKEPAASLIKWVFQELSNGTLAIDQIRREANKKGLRCSRSNFWTVVRNPVYCGKIFIPKLKDDESCLVQGQHEPLISEALFYDVQDVLDGRKRKERPNTKIVSQDNLPLRGFLVCPKCNRILTGSASKGRHAIYYYYHCVSSCGCRYRANHTNDKFVEELQKFKPHAGVIDLYKIVVGKAYKNYSSQQQNGSKLLVDEMKKINDRLTKARQLLLSEDIDPIDYRTIKMECEDKLMRLEAKLAETTTNTSTTIGIDKFIDTAVSTLSHLDIIYMEASVTRKREIIGSIYPEKLCFDGNGYRTARLNEAVRLIYQINNELGTIKNRKDAALSHLSGWVAPTGIEPVSKV